MRSLSTPAGIQAALRLGARRVHVAHELGRYPASRSTWATSPPM